MTFEECWIQVLKSPDFFHNLRFTSRVKSLCESAFAQGIEEGKRQILVEAKARADAKKEPKGA